MNRIKLSKVSMKFRLGDLSEGRISDLDKSINMIKLHFKAAKRHIYKHLIEKGLTKEQINNSYIYKINLDSDSNSIEIICKPM